MIWKITFREFDGSASRIEFLVAVSASAASKSAIDRFGMGTWHRLDAVAA
jgi:hypothetical protein